MGNLTLPGGPQAAFGQFETYEPFIIVDVADLSAETALANTDNGEVMDVNDELFACGWYEDGSEVCQPFYLDPRDGGNALTLPMEIGETSYQSGAAFALSESTGFDMSEIVIVGWVEEDAGDPEAAYWTNDGTDWSLHLVPTLTGMDSKAYGISDDGAVIVGWFDYLGVTSRPFTCDISGPTTVQWWNIPGDAYGTDDDGGFFVGTKLTTPPIAYFFDRSTLSDLTIDDYEGTYAFDINDVGLVVGYAVDTTPDPDLYDGVIWYYDDLEEEWASYIFSQDNPDPVDSSLTAISNELEDGAVDIVGTYFDGAVPDGVFYVTVNSSGSYKSYSLDAVTSGQNAHLPLALFPLRIRLNVEEYSWTPQTYSARGINRIATIAGSYLDGASSNAQIRPCLYVANDLDNNGLPDIREILQGRLQGTPLELDDNDNWMLDRAELMRVGLHTPGAASGPDGGLDPVQIVRFKINIKPRGEDPTLEIANEDFIDEFVDEMTPECQTCLDFTDRVVNWGTGAVRSNDEQSEILIRVHSMMGDEAWWGNYEGLPADSTIEAEAMEDIRTFAYRFAHCLDWLQWGNESFGGAEGYKIRHDELSAGCEWTGNALTLGEILADPELGEDCVWEAVELILQWQENEMEAARIGSALAGRPLRMASSGVSSNSVVNGYDPQTEPDEVESNIVIEVADWCNRNRAYFDMHVHYQTVAHAQDAITKLVDAYAPWDVPEGRIAAEVGAMAKFSNGWWDLYTFSERSNGYEFRLYFDYPEHGQGEEPTVKYETFVSAWRSHQQGQWGLDGPRFDLVFDAFSNAGFNAICYSARQYGIGTYNSPSPYLIEAVFANQVRSSDYFVSGNGTIRATPLAAEYGTASASHKIDDFEPHNTACDPDHTCPGCDQN